MKYEVYTGFNPEQMGEYFSKRGWPVTTVLRTEVDLVPVKEGAALECGDGRFDNLEEREMRGVRILGGVNAIMALLTGGDKTGLLRATELIRRFGAAPGTHSADHGGCGYADLWINGQLDSALYPYELLNMGEGDGKRGLWLRETMKGLGGKHFRLNGNHLEKGVRVNPFRGLTEAASDGLRFRIDDWFMADLGVPDKVRFFKIAEVVEKLKPEAANLEIIVPILGR